MKALYGLYADAEGAQRAADALRAASSELKFNPRQIVIVSGEPHAMRPMFTMSSQVASVLLASAASEARRRNSFVVT